MAEIQVKEAAWEMSINLGTYEELSLNLVSAACVVLG